jgi:hypothetical protein
MVANEFQLEILIKAWETMQTLAKGNGETAWRIRAWAVTLWSAMMAYAYQNHSPAIIYIAIVALVVLFFIEAAVRQIQYKFIQKSLEIESSLKSILEGDKFVLPDNGITTNIENPALISFLNLFQIKRWIFWFPYLLLLISSLLAVKLLGNP